MKYKISRMECRAGGVAIERAKALFLREHQGEYTTVSARMIDMTRDDWIVEVVGMVAHETVRGDNEQPPFPEPVAIPDTDDGDDGLVRLGRIDKWVRTYRHDLKLAGDDRGVAACTTILKKIAVERER